MSLNSFLSELLDALMDNPKAISRELSEPLADILDTLNGKPNTPRRNAPKQKINTQTVIYRWIYILVISASPSP